MPGFEWIGKEEERATKKVFKEVIRLSNFAFDEKYPAWISNSLTTIELTLKKTLNEIKQYENKK